MRFKNLNDMIEVLETVNKLIDTPEQEQIVHCNECCHRESVSSGAYFGCIYSSVQNPPTGYCSHGEVGPEKKVKKDERK